MPEADLALLTEAAGLPQLRRLRIHTRLPVVLPSRITARLVALLSGNRLRSVIVPWPSRAVAALRIRFRSACTIWSRSSSMSGRPGS